MKVTPSEIAQGPVAHDAVAAGNPVPIGGTAITGSPSSVSNLDSVRAHFDEYGRLGVFLTADGNATPVTISSGSSDALASSTNKGPVGISFLYALGPDGALDRIRTAENSGPGFGALNVAPIGGDITLRASAVAGEASGTSTAVDNLGWVKGFTAHFDITAVPSGGAPTLDLYIQTQLASGDWQDIVHYPQITTSTTNHIVSWESTGSNMGTQAEGAAVTVDNYFQEQDAALTVSTIRKMPLGDSMRVKWVFAAGGSTGDYTFAVTMSARS